MAVTEKKTALDPLDFLGIDALLDDEERAIRDTVRSFVREKVLPDVGDWFEQGILPRELMAELGKLGLFGMHLDGYGLPGASAVAYGLTCLELHAGQAVRDRARAGEAVPFEVHSEQAELRELLEDLPREDTLLEPVADFVEDVVADELPHGVADRPLLVVEKRVDREEVERVESRALCRGRHALDILRNAVERLTGVSGGTYTVVD